MCVFQFHYFRYIYDVFVWAPRSSSNSLSGKAQTNTQFLGWLHAALPWSAPRKMVKWIPPTDGMFKINVDGGIAKNTCKGAAGAVCWDDQGVYIGSSARVIDD